MKAFLLLLFPAMLWGEELDFLGEELDLPEGFEVDADKPHEPLGFSANRKYFREMQKVEDLYRKRFSEVIMHADGAEIFLLSFTLKEHVLDAERDRYLIISPYSSFSEILLRKRLAGEELKQCRDHSIKLLQSPSDDGGPMCHFPIHGIRLFRGEFVIFETSLCWHCGNYFMYYPAMDKASWVGFNYPEIEEFLKKLLPIPQSEIDRFNAEHGEVSDEVEME